MKTNNNILVMLTGIFTILLGGAVLFGWWFDFPVLTHIKSDWVAMAPSTALCFLLSGLTVLNNRQSLHVPVPLSQRGFIWLIILLAGVRITDLLFGQQSGLESFISVTHYDNIQHMAPLTAIGFLLFSGGMLAIHRAENRRAEIAARIMAGTLLFIGLFGTIGFWLNFKFIFSNLYTGTRLNWMAVHTAVGFSILGLGLFCRALHCKLRDETSSVEQQAILIYRSTLLVLCTTAIITGLIGLSYLEQTIKQQASSNMSQLRDARITYIENNLDNRIQRALVVENQSETKKITTALLRHIGNPSTLVRAKHTFAPLLSYGFSGIAVVGAGQQFTLAGHLLPDTITGIPVLEEGNEATLLWNNGYFLRLRIPVGGNPDSGARPGFLIFEQSLPKLSEVFNAANRWMKTGAMVMCSRLNQQQLQCFPYRKKPSMFVIPDTYQGRSIPMSYALAGQSNIETLVDYRGTDVLSAYGPVGNTGLGLVVNIDLNEIYAPIRSELWVGIPLIAFMIALGIWIVRTRVRPLIGNISSAYAAESTANERFNAAMQNSPDGFAIYSSITNPAGHVVDFRCEYLNRKAELMVSFLAENLPKDREGNLVGNTFLDIFPERAATFEKFRMVALTGQMQSEELSLPGQGDASEWYLRQVVPMQHGIAVTYRDITQEKLLLHQLQQSNQLRAAILQGAAYSIISTDLNGTILSFNDAAERMLWYRADELIGKATPQTFHIEEEVRERAKSLSQEFGCEVQPGFDVFVAKTKMNLTEEREWTYVRKDGSRFPVLLSVTALRDENNNISGYLGVAYDISERKRNDEYIRHIALHDVLTGLPNRALLDDRVMIAIEHQRRNNIPFALAMMDIDRFKNINDTMGHHIGDLILKEFVARIKTCLRPTDTLARMGGDEFVLLLSDSEKSGAAIVMERIQNALTPPINVDVQEVHITSSIGISLSPKDGDDMNELMRRADVAMYWVKENGRNGYKEFSSSMDSGGADRLILERDLHIALDNGGFTLFYQPKVNLETGIISGVEALIRMHKADGQFVSPADFIPLAEDIGLIVPIGLWALDTACQDAVRLQQSLGTALNVAVNISPRQFMNGNLVEAVNNVLDRTRLDASLLELEITEGVLMDERNNVSTALSELHTLGVKIAIDDFGTGYSSLSYLKRFPIGTLKIDQSFVRDMTSDAGDAHLVNAIIAMGHSLNIPIVAEGIETAEQLALLRVNNCDLGQGFYIGRPMPFDALLQWFATDSRWKLDKTQS